MTNFALKSLAVPSNTVKCRRVLAQIPETTYLSENTAGVNETGSAQRSSSLRCRTRTIAHESCLSAACGAKQCLEGGGLLAFASGGRGALLCGRMHDVLVSWCRKRKLQRLGANIYVTLPASLDEELSELSLEFDFEWPDEGGCCRARPRPRPRPRPRWRFRAGPPSCSDSVASLSDGMRRASMSSGTSSTEGRNRACARRVLWAPPSVTQNFIRRMMDSLSSADLNIKDNVHLVVLPLAFLVAWLRRGQLHCKVAGRPGRDGRLYRNDTAPQRKLSSKRKGAGRRVVELCGMRANISHKSPSSDAIGT